MYPDCYGIDMSQLGRFIAFEAAITLLRERGDDALITEVQERCEAQQDVPAENMTNEVQRIYDQFTQEELSQQIAKLVRSPELKFDGEIEVLYQTIEGLRSAMPEHTGDWYFTGEYPTPGGYRVLNTAFLNWCRNDDSRAY